MKGLIYYTEIKKNGIKTFYATNQVSKLHRHIVQELKSLEPTIGTKETQSTESIRLSLIKLNFNESLKKHYNDTVVIITKAKYN